MKGYVVSPPAATSDDQAAAISPELVLVDPMLATSARARLGEPGIRLARAADAPAAPFAPVWRGSDPSLRRLETSRRVLIAVAGVTIVLLLFFDVRVEVGQKPASAERPETSVGPTATTPKTKPQSARTSSAPPSRPLPMDRKFAWAPVAEATGYHVEFFRRQERVFAQDTPQPQVTVPARWAYRGGRQSFHAGQYRWYVWAIISGLRQPHAAVQATVTIAGNP
jgi:hypothetical protein